jgi:hypothetical protein
MVQSVGRWLGIAKRRPFESGPCRKGAVGIGYLAFDCKSISFPSRELLADAAFLPLLFGSVAQWAEQ